MEHSSVDGSQNSLRFLFCVETPLRFHRNHVIYPITVVAFLSITAFVGNVFILIALNKISSIHPPSKLLFRCLAVTDILVALVAVPLHAVYLFSIRTMTEEGNIVCLYTATFSITIATTLCGVSLTTSAAISLDRLMALVLGLRYRHVVTFKRTFSVVIGLWALGIILTAVSFWGFTLNKSMIFIALAVLVFCVTVSGVGYTKIVLILRNRETQIASHSQAAFSPNISRLRKVVCSALWVQVILEVCYVPFLVVTTLFIFNKSGRTQSLFIAWEFTGILIFLSSSLNPFLYCYKIPEVRQAVRRTIRQVFRLSNEADAVINSTRS